MIYKLKPDYKNTYSLLIENVELGTKMPKYNPRFLGKSRLAEWVMPEASFYYSANFEGQGESIPDITTWSAGVLVISPKAYAVFHDYLARSGEFLPISVGDEIYYLFNTLYVIPEAAINREKAVEVIDTGVHFGQSNVIFDELALNAGNIIVFKTSTDKLLYSFCSEQFKKMYSANSFKGLIFEDVI